jgi:hypothetical protein
MKKSPDPRPERISLRENEAQEFKNILFARWD